MAKEHNTFSSFSQMLSFVSRALSSTGVSSLPHVALNTVGRITYHQQEEDEEGVWLHIFLCSANRRKRILGLKFESLCLKGPKSVCTWGYFVQDPDLLRIQTSHPVMRHYIDWAIQFLLWVIKLMTSLQLRQCVWYARVKHPLISGHLSRVSSNYTCNVLSSGTSASTRKSQNRS
jgi:hypothetical protein